jgi:hypothetical protein
MVTDDYNNQINDFLGSKEQSPMTEDEKKCILDRLKAEMNDFKVSPMTTEAMQGEVNLYGATEDLITRMEKSPVYKNIKKANPDLNVELMREDNIGIGDTAWCTKHMLETYVFRKLLGMFPDDFGNNKGIFEKGMFLDKTRIYTYYLNKKKEIKEKKCINEETNADYCSPITADRIGFAYETLKDEEEKLNKYFECLIGGEVEATNLTLMLFYDFSPSVDFSKCS